VGETTNVTVNVQAIGSATWGNIIDLEVQNASHQKVFQQFYSDQYFAANQTQSYTAVWTPNAPGTYTVHVGVFGPGWAGPLYWGTPATAAVLARGTAHAVTTPTVASMQIIPAPVPVVMAAAVVQQPIPRATSKFYVDPKSPASGQVNTWQSARPGDAKRMRMIAEQPTAVWLGGWNANVAQAANEVVSAAANAGSVPVLVAYNIPGRDCGGFSAGGATNASEYEAWIRSLTNGIGSRPALVVLEPDGLASLDCLSAADQATRMNLLSHAVHSLKSLGKTSVYVDAGNSSWISAPVMASRLNQAGIAEADGFALNVSNFNKTNESEAFGAAVSALVHNKHFVVDTSRNGVGPTSDHAWCNPGGRALGPLPTTDTHDSLADAFLWIKRPGESDGACNGGPSAGVWWPEYALGLATAAGY
jgi:endoglucanase